jgi:transposase InsO family protein
MYYRLKKRVDRWGLEALRVRKRRRPRMPNELGPHIEQRIIAFSLADPGYGPRRISAELEREKWGGLRISEHGVWRVLRRYGSNTRAGRFALIAGYAARYERRPPEPPEPRRIAAGRPGELVGLDCSFIGRLSGTKGSVWQYTAIDLASGFAWGELHASPKNPRARHCRALVDRMARELAQTGWRLEAAISDNGSEFRSRELADRLTELGVEHRRIGAGRPTANGDVERLQQTILEECWRPLAGAQADRPRELPLDLQPRPRPHRLAHPRSDPRRHRLRCPQDEAREMSGCRYISGLAHASR